MSLTKDQIDSFPESERKFVTLTLYIDKNGILSLTKATMELQESVSEIETLDTRTNNQELNQRQVRSRTVQEPHQSKKIKKRNQHDAVSL